MKKDALKELELPFEVKAGMRTSKAEGGSFEAYPARGVNTELWSLALVSRKSRIGSTDRGSVLKCGLSLRMPLGGGEEVGCSPAPLNRNWQGSVTEPAVLISTPGDSCVSRTSVLDTGGS